MDENTWSDRLEFLPFHLFLNLFFLLIAAEANPGLSGDHCFLGFAFDFINPILHLLKGFSQMRNLLVFYLRLR